MYLIKRVFNPEIFQGKYKRKNYFEGWYFKNIDRSMENVLAVIPGVAFGSSEEENHAFIQVLDARACISKYYKFDMSCFKYNENRLEIEIGGSFFSKQHIRLNIDDKDIRLYGSLSFENAKAFPKTLLRPGIMGPFSFIPFMECYHGVVSIHHEIYGSLKLNDKEINFNNGYGYIEKDWGKSFPEAWVWLQSNHFGKDDVSLMLSVAKIPWMGRFFLGLISFLRIGEKTHLFATYTKAKIKRLSYMDNTLNAVVEDRKYLLEISAFHSDTGTLKAPKNGLMDREVLETITAVVKVRLSSKNGHIIYEGEGYNTGLEIESGIFKYFTS